MINEDIIRLFNQLGVQGQFALIEDLTEIATSKREGSLAQEMVMVMENLIGGPISQGRTQADVVARVVLAWKMLDMGYRTTTIGTVLGRNHSTISEYKHTIKNALTYPNQYSDVLGLKRRYDDAWDMHGLTDKDKELIAQAKTLRIGQFAESDELKEQCEGERAKNIIGGISKKLYYQERMRYDG